MESCCPGHELEDEMASVGCLGVEDIVILELQKIESAYSM